MSTKNLYAGVIIVADRHYYGSAPASADLAATVSAAMAKVDSNYAYTNAGKDIAVYALPARWSDKDVDGTDRDVIELVTAGRMLGTVGSFSRQNLDAVPAADVLRDRLRVSVDVEGGHRVDIEIDPDFEFADEDGARLLTMQIRLAGTWFDGITHLHASEWIDEYGDFEEQASHWSCNDVGRWREAVPGPEFEEDAWEAIKEAIRSSGIDLTEYADEEEHEDA